MSGPKSPLPEERGPTFAPTTHWCARHLEPFRETWGESAAWAAATIALFNECVRRREILQACGWRPETDEQPEVAADSRMLDRVLREYAPLCCFLGDEVTGKWTRLALGPMDEFKAAHAELRARTAESEDSE